MSLPPSLPQDFYNRVSINNFHAHVDDILLKQQKKHPLIRKVHLKLPFTSASTRDVAYTASSSDKVTLYVAQFIHSTVYGDVPDSHF